VISNSYPLLFSTPPPIGNSNNTIEENEISKNNVGIFSNASNSTINKNKICGNTILDFNSGDWLSSYGNNNTCDKPDRWNDTETTRCTYSCPACYTNTAGICTINIGEDCSCINQALNDTNCKEVKMQGDIINWSGTCIDNPQNFTNKIFDCQGYLIIGNSIYNTWPDAGIYLNTISGNTIKNCIVTDFHNGIYLYLSSNNTIINNKVNNNNYSGIYLDSSSNYNIITNNNANDNGYGIILSGAFLSSNNTLTSNTANSNDWCGIFLGYSSNNTLTSNTANSNSGGICLYTHANNNNIINNAANDNINYGIDLGSFANNNALTHNTANNNTYGIHLDYYSNSNNLTHNNIMNNIHDGIYINSTSSNTGMNNNFICFNGHTTDIVNNNASTAGGNNTCDNADGWSDTSMKNAGKTGCTYRCECVYFSDNDHDGHKSIDCGGTDCNDSNSHINPDTVWFYDVDNDTYGNATNYIISCNKPTTGNYVLYNLGLDCDDNNASITNQCCRQFDFDNNAAVDIFDVVSALENLSGGNAQIYNTICSEANGNGRIDLIDLFALITKIVTE